MGGIMAKKKKFHRLVERMAKDMLHSQGGEASLEKGSTHVKLVLVIHGKRHTLAVSSTPRKEETALWNTEKQLRKLLKGMAG